MNIVDIIIIIFIFISVVRGFTTGFIKSLFETLGVIISFFIAKEFYYIVEDFILAKTKLLEKLCDFFAKKASGFTDFIQNGTSDIVTAIQQSLKLPPELNKFIVENMISGQTGVGNIDAFVMSISSLVVRCISFFIAFLVVYAVLVVIFNLADLLFKLPILNLTNKLFGAAMGAIKGIIVLYIVFALASPFIAFTQDNTVTKSILESQSSEYFYENNIILNYLYLKGFLEK